MDNRQIMSRIRSRLRTLEKTPRGASMDAGLGPDVIRDLERKPNVMPRLDTIEALAAVLKTTPDWLAFGRRTSAPEDAEPTPQLLLIKGEVAAGHWLELDADFDQDEFEQRPVPLDPRYPAEAQYGLFVKGTSVNKVAQSGDILQCVDVAMTGIEPVEDELVIVERRRFQSGQKEVTAKRWRRRGKVVELYPDSTDERWQEPILFDPKKAHPDEEVAIIALVIAVYKPLQRSLPRRPHR
jgi:transcriptional regulator with XRE-family HTH domain